MKCPVCYASQEIFENEVVHICPYCDAILINDGRSLRRVDIFPWWIKKKRETGENEGIIITDGNELHFSYTNGWILNREYKLLKIDGSRGKMKERVIEVYGRLPVLAFPGVYIGVEWESSPVIRHPGGSAIFERIEK